MRYLVLSIQVITLLLTFSSLAFSDKGRHVEYPTYSAHVNDVNIAYQDFGDTEDETILLVMGLGAQLITWDDRLVFALVDAGYRVIRFDNRDVGWSEKLFDAPTPGWLTGIQFKLGLPMSAPYTLDDMADDAIALLNYLNIDRAHVVGASMGGMIAQIMAAKYPNQIASLTSIMSTSGAAHLPQGSVQLQLGSDAETRDDIIEETVELVKTFGGSVADVSDEDWYSRIARAYNRSYYPDGTARQLWAIVASGDRVEQLKTIKQPTVVIHGKDDQLIPYQAGEHTAELINGAKLVLLDGMGHHIDQISRPRVVHEILEVVSRPTAVALAK